MIRRSVCVSVRAPAEIAERIDTLASSAGLTRSQFLRLVLARLGPGDVPLDLVASRDHIEAARGAR
jgi:hypothetical protein